MSVVTVNLGIINKNRVEIGFASNNKSFLNNPKLSRDLPVTRRRRPASPPRTPQRRSSTTVYAVEVLRRRVFHVFYIVYYYKIYSSFQTFMFEKSCACDILILNLAYKLTIFIEVRNKEHVNTSIS